MKPSTAAVLRLLRERGDAGFAPLEALEACGSFRLGARIWELVHEEGHRIETDMVTVPSGARVARYRLIEPKPVTVAALPLWDAS